MHWLSDTGHVLWANKTEMRVLGYSPEEYIGQSIMKFCPDEEELVLEIFKSLGTGNTIKDVPVRFRTKDGRIQHLLIDSNVNYKPDGSFNHTRCFIRDDTGRKIKDARADVATKEAARSLQQLDQFICKAFHNIRTPCHIMTQLLEGLKEAVESTKEANPEETRELLQMCMRSSTGLMNVLDDAADASRFEQGLTITVQQEPVRLDHLAKSVVQALQHTQYTVKEGVEVKLDLSGEGPRAVLGDYKLLHRVLFHLVENSVKATTAGEVKLAIRSDGTECHFEVSDTGEGIQGGAEAVRAVFQRYWQSPPQEALAVKGTLEALNAATGVQAIREALDHTLSVSSGCEGLGLGLNVAFNLVQCMGGALEVVTGEGGSTFCFKLKLGAAPHEGEVPPAPLSAVQDSQQAMKVAAQLHAREMVWEQERDSHLNSEVNVNTTDGSDSAESEDSSRNSSTSTSVTNEALVGEGVFESDRAVHVLLVEDNTMCRRVVTKQLIKFGCTVDAAEDGQVAVDKIKLNNLSGFYDLVLMDLRMPVMDGFEATRHIRNELKSDVLVVALSGETGQVEGKDVQVLCKEIGFTGFMAKPCKPPMLKAALKDYLPEYLASKIK